MRIFPIKRNSKLIKLLSKLKPLEKRSRVSKANLYIKKLYDNSQELQEVRENLFNCSGE